MKGERIGGGGLYIDFGGVSAWLVEEAGKLCRELEGEPIMRVPRVKGRTFSATVAF